MRRKADAPHWNIRLPQSRPGGQSQNYQSLLEWGCVSAIDSCGRTIWIVDAHRGDGRRFIVRADEILSAFIELERQVLTVTFYLESIKPET
jgi:hypothetical protein